MSEDTDFSVSDLNADVVEKLLRERGRTHGVWSETAEVSQGMKAALRFSGRWDSLPETVREALDMMCVKMARIVCGDWANRDHWADCEGYSRLVSRGLRPKSGE